MNAVTMLAITLLLIASTISAAPPNIVFMYADNLGFGDLGCYGNTEVKTPHLDRLAAEGVRCEMGCCTSSWSRKTGTASACRIASASCRSI